MTREFTPEMVTAVRAMEKDHLEAWLYAWGRREDSNLARCYLDLCLETIGPKKLEPQEGAAFTHVDDVIYQPGKWPDFLIAFVTFHRMPAVEKSNLERCGMKPPEVWADNVVDNPCRLVMVSRLGDVGVNFSGEPTGYTMRYTLDELKNFRRQRKPR